uniref:Putative ovule protein n=1 Tax=Solanum chacoense TaxID=4108 RepID=A0A0V0GW49_SOLCH
MLLLWSSWLFIYAYLRCFVFVLNSGLFEKKCVLRYTLLTSLKQALVAFFRFSLPKTLLLHIPQPNQPSETVHLQLVVSAFG